MGKWGVKITGSADFLLNVSAASWDEDRPTKVFVCFLAGGGEGPGLVDEMRYPVPKYRYAPDVSRGCMPAKVGQTVIVRAWRYSENDRFEARVPAVVALKLIVVTEPEATVTMKYEA